MDMHHMLLSGRDDASDCPSQGPSEMCLDGDWLARSSHSNLSLKYRFYHIGSEKHFHLVGANSSYVEPV